MSDNAGPGVAIGARRDAWPIRILKIVAATLLFAMAALTFIDVIGRYVLNAPIPGTFETVGLMLGVATFAAFPIVTMQRSHITVDLFDRFIRGRVRQVQQFVILIGSAGVVAFLCERLWATASDELANDFVTEYFGISRAPLLYLISFLCAVTFVILLMMTWRYVRGGYELEDSAHPPASSH